MFLANTSVAGEIFPSMFDGCDFKSNRKLSLCLVLSGQACQLASAIICDSMTLMPIALRFHLTYLSICSCRWYVYNKEKCLIVVTSHSTWVASVRNL